MPVRLLTFLILFSLQTPALDPLPAVRTIVRQLRDHYDEHRDTRGATSDLTTAKHQLRDWVETRLAEESADFDTRAFAARLHTALRDADLICNACDENALGYADDIRISREGEFLVVVLPLGIGCSYDESAYLYARRNGQWRRIWDLEQNTYTPQAYLSEGIHDIQMSAPDANGRRVLLVLGSQTRCFGSFKSIYARAWQLQPDDRTTAVLDWTDLAYDDYPPILGRAQPDDVLIQYTAGGFLSGDVHVAVRHFKLEGGSARLVDPTATLPRDFVLEWLSAPWEESRLHAESPALEAQHATLHRTDRVGDIPEATRRCTAGADLWQVGTALFEGPKRYYRVRWIEPSTFTVVAISPTPFPDCTLTDSRGTTYPDVLGSRVR